MKKNNIIIISIILSIITIAIISFSLYKIYNGGKAKGDGVVTVELIDLDSTVIKKVDIPFTNGDSIVTLIEANFANVRFNNGMLLDIEDYKTPSDFSTFLYIYINSEASNYGLTDGNFTFNDGDKISLVITEFVYDYE